MRCDHLSFRSFAVYFVLKARGHSQESTKLLRSKIQSLPWLRLADVLLRRAPIPKAIKGGSRRATVDDIDEGIVLEMFGRHVAILTNLGI